MTPPPMTATSNELRGEGPTILLAIVAWRSWQTGRVSNRHDRLRSARLYLVSDTQADEFLDAALAGGVDIVQLRMKGATEEAIIASARRFQSVCSRHGALLVVNDRPDLAALLDADGVHIGQDDTPVHEARAIIGEHRLLGVSTHTREQVDAARDAGADYIGVGPVHETPTKPGRRAVGAELIRYAAGHAQVPFFAIGGISTANVHEVLAAGAERIAVVRALSQAPDPQRTARQLRGALRDAHQRPEASVGST